MKAKYFVGLLAIAISACIAFFGLSSLVSLQTITFEQSTSTELADRIDRGHNLVAFFGLQGCPACRRVKPIVAEERDRSNRVVLEVDLAADPDPQVIQERFQVDLSPTVIVFKRGIEVGRLRGAFSEKDYLQLISK